jgi:Domain of unknown function (DUF4404)
MSERDLHGLLTDLHHKLQNPPAGVNDNARTLFAQLADDLKPIVEGGPGGPIAGGKAAGLRERLNAAMAAVEVSHPQLASAIEHVADTLAFYNL